LLMCTLFQVNLGRKTKNHWKEYYSNLFLFILGYKQKTLKKMPLYV